MAAGYDQGLGKVPEEILSVHNKLRRCVVGYDGTVNYYLHPENSMWKDEPGSYRELSVDNADGLVVDVTPGYGVVTDNLQVGNYAVTVSGDVASGNIGCVMCIFDDTAAAWYAVIIGADVDKQMYILAHPHIDGFGNVGEEKKAYYMIGDAKLGGQEGNVMVEIPSFWHKWSYEPDPKNADDLTNRAYYGWQHHQISLNEISGGKYYPQRYVAAFEGVLADAANNPQDGWYGAWQEDTSTWEEVTQTEAPANAKILSVAGYYARTFLSVTDFRPICENTGTGYHQYDAATNFIIQLLMTIELGHMQTQIELGSGINNISGADWTPYNGYRTIRKTGDTISAGNGTRDLTKDNQYIQIASNKYNIFSLSYRGIEQPYGHIFKWVDGIVFSGDGGIVTAYAHKCIDGGVAAPKQYKSHLSPAAAEGDANYIKLPAIESSDLAIVNVSRYWKSPSPHLLPNDDAKSRPIDAYTHDWFNQSGNGMRAFAVGGGANYGRYVGAFYVNSSYGLGTSYSAIGGRLCKN